MPRVGRSRRLPRNKRGASSVEYGMLAGLIAVAAIGAVNAAGGSIANLLSGSAQAISGAAPGGGAEAVAATAVVGEQPPSGSYRAGDPVRYEVTFDQPVAVSGGTPSITLDVGGSPFELPLVAGSGSQTLAFEAPLPSGVSDADGLEIVGGGIAANGAEIKAGGGGVETALSGDLSGVVAGEFAPTFEGLSTTLARAYVGQAMDPLQVIFSDLNGDSLGLFMDQGLPGGLSFADNGDGTGTVSGTPSAVGETTGLTVTADDGFQSTTSDPFAIDVSIFGKIIASDAAADDNFGWDVDMGPGYAVVGARRRGADDLGGAYVYDLSDPDNPVETIIDAPAGTSADDQFGQAVDVDPATGRALISSRYGDKAHLYDVSSPTSPTLLGTIQIPNGKSVSRFGWDVALDGDRAVVMAESDQDVFNVPTGNGYNTYGSSFLVFDVSSPSAPVYEGYGFIQNPAEWENRTKGVDLQGDTVLLSSIWRNDTTGAVHVFDLSDPSSPTQVHTIVASDAAQGDAFGYASAMEGSVAAISATQNGSGRVYLFDLSDPANPIEQTNFGWANASSNALFGFKVDVHAGKLVASAYNHGNRVGAATVFDLGAGFSPSLETEFTAPDGQPYDYLGRAVAIHSGLALASTSADGHSGLTGAGSVYIVDRP